MFTTFRGAQPRQKTRPRPQVRRACNACRLAKIGCDNARPCRNCNKLQIECVLIPVTDGKDGRPPANRSRDLAAATAEVDRLGQRVRDLEAARNASMTRQCPNAGDQNAAILSNSNKSDGSAAEWKVINMGGLEYGQLSTRYFAHRLGTYLDVSVHLEPPPFPRSTEAATSLSACFANGGDALGRTQQDYFLDLFWTGVHVIFPVIEEESFRQLYASLWPSTDSERRDAHPLVDIVLAVNMQFAHGFLPLDDLEPAEDSSSSGSYFYRRCQAMLDQAADTPSLTDVQAQFFVALYLASSGYINAAQAKLKTTEHVLASLAASGGTADSSQRLRQCIRTLDIRLSVALGRMSPSLNSHRILAAPLEAPPFTWLAFSDQMLRLSESVADIADSFLREYTAAYTIEQDFHAPGNTETRNSSALLLREQMAKLRHWADQVPSELIMRRASPGLAFSIHRAPIRFRESDPLWLQRQQLVLECQYHDFTISLYRLFINFSPTPDRGTVNSDNNCISCVNHAVVLTDTIAQILRETDVLTGWHQIQPWLENAAFALAGFAAGYPVCPPTPSARRALNTAAEVFEALGSGSERARKMHSLVKELDAKIANIIRKFKMRVTTGADGRTQPTPFAVNLPPDNNTVDPNLESAHDTLVSPAVPQLSDLPTDVAMQTPPLSWDRTIASPGEAPWMGQSPLDQSLWDDWLPET